MKFYKVNAYAVTNDKKESLLGSVIIEKPLLGKVQDAVSNFPYALLEKDENDVLSGYRLENLDNAEFDIGIYKSALTPDNIATIEQVMEYQEIYPISPVSEKQAELNFLTSTSLGTATSKIK